MVYNTHKLNTAVVTVNIYYVPTVTEIVVNGLFVYLRISNLCPEISAPAAGGGGGVGGGGPPLGLPCPVPGGPPPLLFFRRLCLRHLSAEGGGGGGGGGVTAAARAVGRVGVGGPSSPSSIEYLIVSSPLDISI